MLEQIVVDLAGHLLRPAQWARERLANHAGKRVKVDCFPGPFLLQIDEEGYPVSAADADSADLVISLSPLAIATWLTDRKAGWRQARVEGDMELAAAVSHVMANLRWDYEEDLSRVVGDIAAHRIGSGVRRMSAWPAEVLASAASNMAEFLSEERRLLLTPLRFEEFSDEVDLLRDAAERLEKRLEKLEQFVAESAPP